MKATRIQYTVQQSFVEQNKQNIAKVMEGLRAIGSPDIRYSSYILEDGKTFMHLVVYKDESMTSVMNGIEAFQHFQSELKASNPEVPPKFDNLTIVGSSWDFFA